MADAKLTQTLLAFQKNEITEYKIYEKLSSSVKDPKNREILKRISGEELAHYGFFKQLTGQDVKPDRGKVWFFVHISQWLGLTFGLKLMEGGEGAAQVAYENVFNAVPKIRDIYQQEVEHERQLLEMIDEERLRYISSAVLGLNDALVELTGALAGFTLALQTPRLVAMAGLITGIAASFSMASSSYLQAKTEENEKKDPLKAALYTGGAYLVTVFLLVLPFLVLQQVFISLTLSLLSAVAVIFVFTFYISVAKGISFKARFMEMLSISLGVSALTFGIGFLVRLFFHIEV